MIVDAIRPIGFENKKGCYFIINTDGLGILSSERTETQGLNLLDIQDLQGEHVFRGMIQIVKQSNEGFYEHHVYKPVRNGKSLKKISFVKLFEPYNWLIGTDLHVADVEDKLKADLFLRVSRIRFGKEGYIFINRFNGDALISNGKVFPGTKKRKLWEIFNKKSEIVKDIFAKEYKAALKPSGDYIYYSWQKLTDSAQESPKTSFIYGIPELKWIVGAGIYLDDIESDIAVIRNDLINQTKQKIVYFCLIVTGISVIIILFFSWLNSRLKNDFNLFLSFFNRAVQSDETINREKIKFIELDHMAEYANKMLIERKEAEAALKKSEKQFRNLFVTITDLIYTQDMEGHFTSANPAMLKLLGYEMDELIGYRASDFMEPAFQSDFVSRYLDVVKKHGSKSGISCYFKKKEKICLEYKSFFVDQEGGEPYISGIGKDVTEKVLSEEKVKKLQAQVAQSQKMESIGTLAGGVAHDFNNILFPILGHAEMLLEDIPKDSQYRGSLEGIYASALRAKELVKQILTFSRHDTNELKLMKMQPIIKEAMKLIRSSIPATIEIKQDIKADCGIVKADPTQIHQIIMNLATNAYHAMEETGGRLNVSLNEVKLTALDIVTPDMAPGRYARLTVADTGKGMENELIHKIFDPFFTTKEKGKGTGMGLSMVHGIVKGMGGSVQVYSEPGKGATFQVYLPIEEMSSDKKTASSKVDNQRGEEHILLVDDEEAILTMEKQVLERLGYQVTSRISSIDALEAFRHHPDEFDMVITDMTMPNMPGDKLAAELIKIRPGIPILLCTGFSETMSEEKAASLGIKGFLLKPIVMNDFSQMIRSVLSN